MNVLRRGEIDSAVDRVGTIGGGAVQALRLMAEMDREETSVSDVRAILQPDPLLVARVLRIANSAFYGNSRDVGTLERAIAILGFDTLRAIAAAACLDQTLTKAGVSRPDAAALLRHSLFAAVAAREVAGVVGSSRAADAFMAGLLHDIGCTVLLVTDRAGTAATPGVGAGAGTATGAAAIALAVEHASLSRRLLERWQLPAWLAESAGQHHDVAAANEPRFAAEAAQCVQIADDLASAAGWSHPFDAAMAATGVTSTGRIPLDGAPAPLDASTRDRLMQDVVREVDAMVQALGAG